MPVFQTFDKTDSWTSTMVRQTFKRNSSSVDRITAQSEKAEEWAWGSGKKWNVPNPVKPKLNLYAAAPKVQWNSQKRGKFEKHRTNFEPLSSTYNTIPPRTKNQQEDM